MHYLIYCIIGPCGHASLICLFQVETPSRCLWLTGNARFVTESHTCHGLVIVSSGEARPLPWSVLQFSPHHLACSLTPNACTLSCLHYQSHSFIHSSNIFTVPGDCGYPWVWRHGPCLDGSYNLTRRVITGVNRLVCTYELWYRGFRRGTSQWGGLVDLDSWSIQGDDVSAEESAAYTAGGGAWAEGSGVRRPMRPKAIGPTAPSSGWVRGIISGPGSSPCSKFTLWNSGGNIEYIWLLKSLKVLFKKAQRLIPFLFTELPLCE